MSHSPKETHDYERDIELLDLLVDHGANLSLLDKRGNSALFDACMNRHFPLAKRLLQIGADPNQPCRSGDTPLHAAVFREDEALVRLLLEHGGDVNSPNRHRKTPFDVCTDGSVRTLLAPHQKTKETSIPTADECVKRLQAIPRFQHIVAEGCTEDEISGLEQQFESNSLWPIGNSFLCSAKGLANSWFQIVGRLRSKICRILLVPARSECSLSERMRLVSYGCSGKQARCGCSIHASGRTTGVFNLVRWRVGLSRGLATAVIADC